MPDTYYCQACGRSIPIGWKQRHLSSQVHKDSLKRNRKRGKFGNVPHTREKKVRQVKAKMMPDRHRHYLVHNDLGRFSNTTKNPLFNNVKWTTRAHYDLLQNELQTGSMGEIFPEFNYAKQKNVEDLTIHDIKAFEKAVDKHQGNDISGFDPKEGYFNFSRDELIYGDAMKVLLTPKGRREWKRTERHFNNNPHVLEPRMERAGRHVGSGITFEETDAGAWMFD